MTTDKDPRNAALIFRSEAYSVTSDRKKTIEGRQAAGASFLEGFIRYSGRKRFYATSPSVEESKDFARQVEELTGGVEKIVHIPFSAFHRAAEPGLVYRPDPLLGEQAWWRRRFGQKLFSLCGVAHTTASNMVMNGLIEVVNAPTQPWDAIICPSKSVRSMITTVIDAQCEYLSSRTGGKATCPVQLPMIPLGINPDHFTPSKARSKGGMSYREKIGAASGDIVVLFVGRLTYNQKMNPALTYMALEEAAKRTRRKIHMVWCGWFTSNQNKALFTEAARSLAPSITVHHVDGRSAEARKYIWHASDIFMALVDNIQETFGLVPVEAMAAGLPVIVTDWDGYRETVTDEAGFRIPTRMAPPGTGDRAAWRYECFAMGYQDYLNAVSQTVHVDIGAAAEALTSLIDSKELRQKMGRAGRAHVAATYDWKHIIPQYQDLWEELNARRETDAEIAPGDEVPRALDPHRLFQAYPTELMDRGDSVEWREWPTMPGALMNFPAGLGVPDAPAQIRRSSTLADLQDQFPDEASRWMHSARVARWALKTLQRK